MPTQDTQTLGHADLLSILALELVFLEGSLPLLDIGFLLVLVQVEDEEAELTFEHVLLPLSQLLLALPQELLMGLLLQSRSLQLLLAATQLLIKERRGQEALQSVLLSSLSAFPLETTVIQGLYNTCHIHPIMSASCRDSNHPSSTVLPSPG